jgi:hypothetical protein
MPTRQGLVARTETGARRRCPASQCQRNPTGQHDQKSDGEYQRSPDDCGCSGYTSNEPEGSPTQPEKDPDLDRCHRDGHRPYEPIMKQAQRAQRPRKRTPTLAATQLACRRRPEDNPEHHDDTIQKCRHQSPRHADQHTAISTGNDPQLHGLHHGRQPSRRRLILSEGQRRPVRCPPLTCNSRRCEVPTAARAAAIPAGAGGCVGQR